MGEIVYKSIGRPSVITKDILSKLEVVLKRGISIKKACIYAGIGEKTFYRNYNTNKEFRDTINDAKDYWLMIASDNLTEILLSNDPKNYETKIALSKWILEKKEPEMFGKKR